MLQLSLLRAAAVAAAAAATFDVLMPRAAADVSGQLTTARAANSFFLSMFTYVAHVFYMWLNCKAILIKVYGFAMQSA